MKQRKQAQRKALSLLATAGLDPRSCTQVFTPPHTGATSDSLTQLESLASVTTTAGEFLVSCGLILLVVGLLWPLISQLGLGRLPGHSSIQHQRFSFCCLITISIAVSLVLKLVFWLVRR